MTTLIATRLPAAGRVVYTVPVPARRSDALTLAERRVLERDAFRAHCAELMAEALS